MASNLLEMGPADRLLEIEPEDEDEDDLDADGDLSRFDPLRNYLPHTPAIRIDPISEGTAPVGAFARGFGATAHGATPSARGLVGLLKQLIEGPPRTGAARAPASAAPSMQSNVAPSWDPTRPFAVQAGPSLRLRSPDGNVGAPLQALGIPSSAHNDPNFRQLSRMPSGIADQMDNQPDRSHGQFGSSDLHDRTGASPSNIAEIGAKSAANADAEAGATTSAATSIRRWSMSPTPLPNAPPWLPGGSESFELPRTLYGDASGWGGGGGGGGRGGRRRRGRRPSKYDRCISASPGEVEDWNAFCRSLPAGGQSKTVGGETPKRACWSKAHESENQKRQFCQNEFGNNG